MIPQQALRFVDIEDEYRRWVDANPQGDPVDLGTWAKGMDQKEYSQARTAAYDPGMLNQFSAGVDRFLNPLSKPTQRGFEAVGNVIDRGLGTEVVGPVMGEVGRDLPRDLAETIPLAFASGGVSLLGKLGPAALKVGKVIQNLTRGLAGGDAALRTYTDTGNPVAAGIVGASVPATDLMLPVVSKFATRLANPGLAQLPNIERMVPEQAQQVLMGLSTGNKLKTHLAGAAAEAGTVMGVQEATRQGVLTAEGITIDDPYRNPLTLENVVATGLGGVMQASPLLVRGALDRGRLNRSAHAMVAEFAEMRAQEVLAGRGERVPTGESAFSHILKSSQNPVEVLGHEWVGKLVRQGLDEMDAATDPVAKQEVVDRLADAFVRTRGLGIVEGEAENMARLNYIIPPSTPEEAAFRIRRVQDLKQAVLDRVEVLNQQSAKESDFFDNQGESTISRKAVEDLQRDGYLPDITMEWVYRTLGEEAERSLTSSDSDVWAMTIQKATNQLIMLTDAAKQRRLEGGKATNRWELRPTDLKEREAYSRFFTAMGQLPRELTIPGEFKPDGTPMSIRDVLMDRFLELSSNPEDTTTQIRTVPMALEVAQIVDRLGGKPGVDWMNDEVELSRTIRETQLDSSTKEVTKGVKRSLGMLVKRTAGKWEHGLVFPDKTDYATQHDEHTAYVADEVENAGDPTALLREEDPSHDTEPPPSGDDALPVEQPDPLNVLVEHADQLRNHITNTSDDDLWNTVAPAFFPRGSVRAGIVESKKPLIRMALEAQLEAGPRLTQKEAGTRIVSPVGQKFIEAVGLKTRGSSAMSDLQQALEKYFTVMDGGLRKSRNLEAVKMVVKAAGIEMNRTAEGGVGPQAEMTLSGGAANMPQEINAYRLFRNFFLRLGYEPNMAEHFGRLGVRVAVNFKDIRTMLAKMGEGEGYRIPTKDAIPTMKRVFNEMTQSGYFAPVSGNQSIIALALDHISGTSPKELAGFHALSVLVHELVHGVQSEANAWGKITPPTPYMRQRVQAYNQLLSAAKFYSPQVKESMLQSLADAVIPKEVLYGSDGQMNKILMGNILYGSNGIMKDGKPAPNYEFINVMSQFVGLGFLTGSRKNVDPHNIYHWMPTEVSMFAKGMYRDLHDNMSALQDAIADPDYREAAGLGPLKDASFISEQVWSMVELSKKMIVAEDVRSTIAEADRWANVLRTEFAGNFTDPVVRSVEVPLDAELNKVWDVIDSPERQQARTDAVRQVQDEMFSVPKIDAPVQQKIPVFSSLFVPFFQVMDKLRARGLNVAADVQYAMSDLQGSAARVTSSLMSPFLMRNEGGRMVFNPSNLTLKMAAQKGQTVARSAVNRIGKWQQDNQKEAFITNDKGELMLSPEAKELQPMFDKLSPADRQAAAGSIKNLQEVYQNGGREVYNAYFSRSAFRVARVIQRLEPSIPWNEAEKAGIGILQGYSIQQQGIASQFMTNLSQPTRDAVASLALQKGGLVESLGELQKFFDKRPWHMSEQRPGRYLIRSRSPEGIINMDGAETNAHVRKLRQELADKGFEVLEVADKTDKSRLANFDAPDQILEKYIEIEERAFEKYLSENPGKLPADVVATLRETYTPGAETSAQLTTRGIQKVMATRKDVPTALGHDYLDNMRYYTTSLAGSISKRALRQRIELILNDRRVDNQTDFKVLVRNQLDSVMSPVPQAAQSTRSFTSAYYLGANLSSMMVEASQSAQTLVPLLMSQDQAGGSMKKAYGTMWKSMTDLQWLTREQNQAEISKLEASHNDKVSKQLQPTEQESKAYLFRRALNEGILDHGVIEDIFFGRDQELLLANKFGHGEYGDVTKASMVRDGVYLLSQKAMLFYSKMSNMNQKLAFMSGLNQGVEAGKSGQDLYNFARATKDLSMFGGGKANHPGYIAKWSNDSTRSAFGIVHTLQQYSYGLIGQFAEFADRGFRKQPGLSPLERKQARRAFGVMLATQVASAGALGVPFIGASLAIVEKIFGVDAKAAVREGLAKLFGEDDETGMTGLLTEVAMTGLPTQMFGLDLSSRLGADGILGTSSYHGFNMTDLFGPAPSIIENAIKALGYAEQGEPVKAARELLPAALKKPLELMQNRVRYGDFGFRDTSDNLLHTPTPWEVGGYAIGFRPSTLAQKRTAHRLVRQSDQNFTARKGRQMDEAARHLTRGDPQPAYAWVREQVGTDPTLDGRDLMRSIAERAVDMTNEYDILARGPRGNDDRRASIMRTFKPEVANRQSETARMAQRQQFEQALGMAPEMDPRGMTKAVLIDQYTRQGMTRGQALRMISLLGY